MKKRIYFIFLVLIFAICISFINTCKKTSNSQKVKIIFSRGKDATPALQKLVEAFNNKQNKIQVELQEILGDTDEKRQKYITQFSINSNDFDVFEGDVIWVAEFASAGYILPLDDYIKRDNIDLSNYFEGSIKAAQYKNKIWGIDNFISAGLLYYRKDIIKQTPQTWDELIEMATKYKGMNGTIYGFTFQANQYEGLTCNVLEYIHAYGGNILDSNGNVIVNSLHTKRGLEEFLKIINSNFVPNDISLYREEDTANSFMQGQTVFCRNWPYLWAKLQESPLANDFAVARLPKGDAKAASTLGGWVGMINKNTKHPNEAWEFVKFMGSEEGQKIRAIYGSNLPTIKSLYKDKEVIKANPFLIDPEFVKALEVTTPRPISPHYTKISKIIQIEVSKLISKEESIDGALLNMQKEISQLNARQ